MKRYICKLLLFISPILLLFAITQVFYTTDQGDLLRLGFLFDDGNYRHNIAERFNEIPIKYKEISKIKLDEEDAFSVLTIGDSFSEQGKFGYKNYLANQDKISVVHFDRFLHDNPIQSLINLVNGDFFEKIKVDFVILQSVERLLVTRVKNIDSLATLSFDSLTVKIANKPTKKIDGLDNKLFSNKIFKFPYTNLQYYFYDKPKESKTYKVKTKSNLFTNKPNTLLFYQDDISNVEVNNDLLRITELNKTLNRLNLKLLKKGIRLIVLPSPDKYDAYYKFIHTSHKYPRPLFFDYYNSMAKSYLYVNSKELITNLINQTKDVYYYDDTHWSPLAAEKIGLEIASIIKKHESTIE